MHPYFANLNRLEFVVTLACTGRCKHCSQGEHPPGGECLDGAVAARVVEDLADPIRSLMTFGGEPLLCPETVCEIHRAGRRMGIPRRELITNGFFSQNPRQIREMARNLAESGVTDVLLSVDAFHQETIPLEPVREFAAGVQEEGISIRTHPAWLAGPSDDNPYNRRTREILREFQILGIADSPGNIIFPSGRAKKYLAAYFEDGPAPADPYEQDPRDIQTISVSPNGDVLDGNVNRQTILKIMDAYSRKEFFP